MASGTQYNCNYYLITSATSIQIIFIYEITCILSSCAIHFVSSKRVLRDSSLLVESSGDAIRTRKLLHSVSLSWLLTEHSNTS